MSQDEMQKAKSCNEMLQFEKPDPKADKKWPVFAFCQPDLAIVNDFKNSLVKTIQEAEVVKPTSTAPTIETTVQANPIVSETASAPNPQTVEEINTFVIIPL